MKYLKITLGTEISYIPLSSAQEVEYAGSSSAELFDESSPEVLAFLTFASEAAKPKEVTMRQGRLALLQAGHLANVSAGIDSLPEPTRTAARIEWEYSNTLQRNQPLVLQMGGVLGLTSQQMDDLFVLAATL